jgi:hypothetical protein
LPIESLSQEQKKNTLRRMSRRDIDRANIPTPQNLLKNQVIHAGYHSTRLG